MSSLGPYGSQPGPYGNQPSPYGQGSPGEYPGQYGQGSYGSQYGHSGGQPGPYPSGGAYPPAPPAPNQYQTHVGGTPPQAPPPWNPSGQTWGGNARLGTWAAAQPQPQPQPAPKPPAPRRQVNAKQIGVAALVVLLVAVVGVAAGIIIKNTGSKPDPVPAPVPSPSPTPTPTSNHGRQVTVFQDLVVEWPEGWNVQEKKPDKGRVSFHYGKGQVWAQVFVATNNPPWDAAHKCNNVLNNWGQDPAKYNLTNVQVTVEPTRVPAAEGFSIGRCALSGIYVKDVSRLRHYSWYGVYRTSDGLNMWLLMEQVDGSGAPAADIEFFQQQVVKAITTAP